MTDTNEPEIMIVEVHQNYYMAMGEEHLEAMLSGKGPYPTPIACVAFRDMAHLSEYVDTGVDGLWSIHPEIVNRLRKAGDILDKVID
ncbi:MAG: hypothetical protein AAGC99_21785 [Pseudomonadota bacterium]